MSKLQTHAFLLLFLMLYLVPRARLFPLSSPRISLLALVVFVDIDANFPGL